MALSNDSTGIWGPVTATIDWCEVSHLVAVGHPFMTHILILPQANYQFSPFFAEIANSFSNVITIFLGLYGGYVAQQQGVPRRYAVAFLVCLVLHSNLDCQLTDSYDLECISRVLPSLD